MITPPIYFGGIFYKEKIMFKNTKMFTKANVCLGEGYITQYTLFENRYIGGIWVYRWNTISQTRFHSHAFSSYCMTLRGWYNEEIIVDGKIHQNHVRKLFRFRHLPYEYTHRITNSSPNAITVVFFSKWRETWVEYFADSDTTITYTWGRKIISKIKGMHM
jgi:hypothetical protein